MQNKLQYKNFISENTENLIIETLIGLFGCNVSIANNSDLEISRTVRRTELCNYVEGEENSCTACKLVTKKLAKRVKETGEAVTGYCPLGLIKTIIPIKVLNTIVGAVYCCGQFYKTKPTEEHIRAIIDKFGFNNKKFRQYLDKIEVINEDKLNLIRERVLRNVSFITKLLYDNYILKELTKREMFLKEITRVILDTNDKDEVISEIVERLAREFDIQRVAIIKSKEDALHIEDDYVNGKNIRLENLSKQEYAYILKRFTIRTKENNGIFVVTSDLVKNSDIPESFKKIWDDTSLKTVTATLVTTNDIERLIIFCSYGVERNWSIDELAFLSAVSEQIAMALKLSKLYDLAEETSNVEV